MSPISRTLVVVLLTFVSTLAAQPVTVAPASPSAGEPFEVRIDAIWRDSCLPENPRLFIAGPRVVITYTIRSGGCLAALMPWKSTVTMPPLAAGQYRLQIEVIDYDGPNVIYDQPLTVAGDAAPFTVWPAFDTAAGNRVVRVTGNFPCPAAACEPPRVLFGSVPSPSVERVSDRELDVVVPLQTNRRFVDLTVEGAGVRPTGFMYTQVTEFERVLIPVITPAPAPGAHGSLWQSELRLVNLGREPLESGIHILFVEPRCSSEQCRPILEPGQLLSPRFATPLLGETTAPTLMVYVRKDYAPWVSFQLRIRDLSRQAETWGTEIPVVRDADLLQQLTLLDVPMRPGFRQKLRLYSPNYAGCCGGTIRFRAADGRLLATRPFSLMRPNGSIGGLAPEPYLREGSRELPLQPGYFEIDLHTIPELEGQDSIWIEAASSARMWGFVAVTNDETQHVTTVTPQ